MTTKQNATIVYDRKTAKTNKIAGSSILSAFFALIGASCCVLPIVLVNLGLSSALASHLGFFARAKPLFMGLTVILIGMAVYLSFKGGRSPNRKTMIILSIAVILVAGSYILPTYESQILTWLNLR